MASMRVRSRQQLILHREGFGNHGRETGVDFSLAYGRVRLLRLAERFDKIGEIILPKGFIEAR